MRLRFRLAASGDDAALRRLLASTPMPGSITVTFEREPDYFAGMRSMGSPWQVILAEDEENGEIAGMLCRAVQERFVNGEERRVGYWGQLRIVPSYEGRVFLRGALELGRRLEADEPACASFAVVAEDNRAARALFDGRHARLLPAFAPLARLVTVGIVLFPSRRAFRADSSFEILDAEKVGMEEVVRFLREQGRAKQLYPAYDLRYFRECAVTPADVLVAAGQGRIRGVAGLWDQSACKQTVVRGYAPPLRFLRPLYNVAAPLLRLQPLPGAGEKMHTVYLSFVATEDNATAPFSALLDAACYRAAARGFSHLMAGFCEGDPLLACARRRPHVPYTAILSAVDAQSPAAHPVAAQLDGRTPYVEIAAL